MSDSRDEAFPLGLILAVAFIAWAIYIAAFLLAGCVVTDAVGNEAKNIGGDLAEVTYCEFESCGTVFLCTMPDTTRNEWCWIDDDAATLTTASGADSCVPTPRGGALGWPCIYCCGSKCGRGANAYQGAYCQ